jgi:hypothetical protein
LSLQKKNIGIISEIYTPEDSDLDARRERVVSTTPRPLYPRERSGTHCTRGWVGPMAGLDVCEKSRPHRDFFLLTVKYTYIVPAFYKLYDKSTHLRHVPRLSMNGAITLLPVYAFTAWAGTALPFSARAIKLHLSSVGF